MARPRPRQCFQKLATMIFSIIKQYLLTVRVNAAQQVLVQVHLVEALKALLPVGVELVLVVAQAAIRHEQGR